MSKELQCGPASGIVSVGVFIVPITGESKQSFDHTFRGCPNCKIYRNGTFCSMCGERIGQYSSTNTQYVPDPDVREDLEKLKLYYMPFLEDQQGSQPVDNSN